MTLTYRIGLLITTVFFISCDRNNDWEKEVRETLAGSTMADARWAMQQEPLTIVDFPCSHSIGGPNDYYSEADFWWPDPQDPEKPYINRDGEINPDIFSGHRYAMIRLSKIVGSLAGAYILTGDEDYARCAFAHAHAWFVDPETKMNPDLKNAQVIKGVAKGRKSGIIDTIHLIEVAQGLYRMQDASVVEAETLNAVKRWFTKYISWLMNHQNGIDEMTATNNHAFCWIMQVGAFARFADNEEMMEFCSLRYKNVLLPQYMSEDGSFRNELRRNKPYFYSLFNMDAIATACQILSTSDDNLWEYSATGGRNAKKGIDFLYPYIMDKSRWPFGQDVTYWESWPLAHPSLLFGAFAYKECRYFDLWKKSDHNISPGEVERNMPVRYPLIWI